MARLIQDRYYDHATRIGYIDTEEQIKGVEIQNYLLSFLTDQYFAELHENIKHILPNDVEKYTLEPVLECLGDRCLGSFMVGYKLNFKISYNNNCELTKPV